MNKVRRWDHITSFDEKMLIEATFMGIREDGDYVSHKDYAALLEEVETLRITLKNARYRIEQGRVWNGMGWTLTGLHAGDQQRILEEIVPVLDRVES